MNALETRIPPPLLVLVAGIAMWGASFIPPTVPVELPWRLAAAGALAAVAAAFAGGGVLAFRRANTTIDPVHPDRAATVVDRGVFRVTRNPMYVGMTLLLLGWAAFLANPWAAIGPVLFAAYIHPFQILPEERALEAKFGPAYVAYRRRVRRWL